MRESGGSKVNMWMSVGFLSFFCNSFIVLSKRFKDFSSSSLLLAFLLRIIIFFLFRFLALPHYHPLLYFTFFSICLIFYAVLLPFLLLFYDVPHSYLSLSFLSISSFLYLILAFPSPTLLLLFLFSLASF